MSARSKAAAHVRAKIIADRPIGTEYLAVLCEGDYDSLFRLRFSSIGYVCLLTGRPRDELLDELQRIAEEEEK